MGITFDDAIEKYMSYASYGLYPVFSSQDICELLEELKEEYAPTIEMTKAQHDLIFKTQDYDRLYEIMGSGDGYYFNSEYWGDLEPHEVASAYLHPETIKIVG